LDPSEVQAKPESATLPSDEIAPGNKIRLSCSDDRNLNGEFQVEFDRKLKLPYQITVDTTGLSAAELQSRLRTSYKPYFRSAPNLTATVAQRDFYVDVQGLVEKPGRYLLKKDSTLDELIAKAGGLQREQGAREPLARYARVTQAEGTAFVRLSEYYAGAAAPTPQWRGGDAVFFQTDGPSLTASGGYLQILGQVVRPGEYAFKDEGDFFYYLSKAGGPTEKADLEKIEVVRVIDFQKKTLTFALKEAKTLPPLKPGDIVMVPPEKPSTAISNMTAIITSVSMALIAAVAL
jgi:protein involved in polysaccharide export with SLBB domain